VFFSLFGRKGAPKKTENKNKAPITRQPVGPSPATSTAPVASAEAGEDSLDFSTYVPRLNRLRLRTCRLRRRNRFRKRPRPLLRCRRWTCPLWLHHSPASPVPPERVSGCKRRRPGHQGNGDPVRERRDRAGARQAFKRGARSGARRFGTAGMADAFRPVTASGHVGGIRGARPGIRGEIRTLPARMARDRRA